MKNYYYLFVFLFLANGCTRVPHQYIDEEFHKYVELFFFEGNKRGLDLRLDEVNLTVEFGELKDAKGLCYYWKDKIVIDRNYWQQIDDITRNWLIFHELGHCVLKRDHRNERTIHGDCLSIMAGTENGFNCSCNYYSQKWRDYYVDELFQSKTILPEWVAKYKDYNFFSTRDLIFYLDTVSVNLEIYALELLNFKNFDVEVTFENWGTSVPSVSFFLGNIGFQNCNKCKVSHSKLTLWGINRNLFDDWTNQNVFESDITLTIRKISDELYFFVNGKYLHNFETDLWNYDCTISTFPIDVPIGMRVSIYELK